MVVVYVLEYLPSGRGDSGAPGREKERQKRRVSGRERVRGELMM
jgi:hypothetical protein